MLMLKGFISSAHRQEHFSLHCCVIYYFNGRLVFILLFGEACIASGTSGLEFYGTVFTLGAQGPGMPELVVFSHPLSFSFFLILFQSIIVYLKHHLGLSVFLALLFHILGENTDDTCMCLFYGDVLIWEVHFRFCFWAELSLCWNSCNSVELFSPLLSLSTAEQEAIDKILLYCEFCAQQMVNILKNISNCFTYRKLENLVN